MEKQTVYKIDSKGKQRIWSIWVEGNPNSLSEYATIEIESGLVDGKKVRESIGISSGKNLGKANETTPYTQAVSEAQAKLELKLRGEYVRDLENATQGVLRSGIQAPMLAQKYHPTGEQKGSKTLEKMKIKGDNIHVQPKLDGNRCLVKIDLDGATMYTRKGDVMPVQLKGILDEIKFCYEKMRLTQELVFDGELFSDEMSFNELNGHLKRKDSQDAEALTKIKYHVYDCMELKGYEVRLQNIKNFFEKVGEFGRELSTIKIIESYPIKATDEAIQEKLEEFLEAGHEGLMIRRLDMPYENKRSWQLCKVKIFEDSEFEILDLEPDSIGRLGFFVMKLDKPSVDSDGKTVTTFKAGISGLSHEEGIKMLKNKQDYIGKMATIEYFGKDVRPRFPKYKGIRQD